ncbi:hypothetical protein [Leptolyngbya sp. FACHB-261]|uniref:hypothetical protein n=1 Tax=Leptolyngbya sp. FACHB-261 TaxID=2692806 RepID=UPI001682E7E2|nr:hypothetical protein [Leptolyngbya sp. FACHB-261]MBD2101581.1 hypothetical protein [Leptolyngbya sp. FACHB-261]
MAKRRNQKKEKALRNQAYARKFRKRTTTGRMGRRRFGEGNRFGDSEGEDEENRGSSNVGAAGDDAAT